MYQDSSHLILIKLQKAVAFPFRKCMQEQQFGG